MQSLGIRPGCVGPGTWLCGARHQRRAGLHQRRFPSSHGTRVPVQAYSATEAPVRSTAAADAAGSSLLQPSHAQVLQGLKGPVVKITAHYHVDFGDCLKVVGSSDEFGAWDAAGAPLMNWSEGDVWSVVMPLGPGDYEFKVVVQKGSGELLWEGGDNRKVSVPEGAPAGSMLVAECCFSFAEQMVQPELQPVSEDVLALLEQQAEAALAAEVEAAAQGIEKQQVSEAAAAVAKALATMDAEAETTVRKALSDSEGSQEDELLAAAVGTSAGISKGLQAAQQEVLIEEEEAAAAAEAEMDAQLEAMASQVHPALGGASASSPDVSSLPPDLTQPAEPITTNTAAVLAKLAQDKPVAVGFMDLPVETAGSAAAAADASAAPAPTAAPGSTSSVVAAFMNRVSAAGAKKPAAPEAAAAPTAEPAAELAAPEPVAAAPAAESTVPAVPEPAAAAAVPAPASAEIPAAAPKQPAKLEDVLAKAKTGEAAATAAVVASLASSATPSPVAASPNSVKPKGWGPPALSSIAGAASSNSSGSGSTIGTKSSSALSSRGRSPSAPATPSSSPKNSRSASPGRGSSHVAAAAAVAAMDWMEGVRSNGVVAAAREAEEAARAKAARLEAAQKAAYAAAAESERLKQNLTLSSSAAAFNSASGSTGGFSGGGGGSVFGSGLPAAPAGIAGGAGSMALSMPAPPEVVPAAQDQVFSMTGTASAMAAAAGLSPPAVSAPGAAPASAATPSAALAADSGLDADAAADAVTFAGGMQLLSAIVGCAAVGTVMWSEFVLKETGCGLPPGPYGLLGAAEGLSYLSVLGFAGAGVAARGSSGGKQGLPGALAVPEVMAYGALAAGLLVLGSQLQQYGYIPPPLPGGQCYPDAAVALPGADDLSAELAAQLTALQAILSQLKTAAADGIDSLQLQEQLTQLQAQVDTFSAYVATQATAVDASLQSGLLQLQDSLTSATSAVSAFVDTTMQQLDIPGKLAAVLDVLRKQEQQLVVELPKQLAELQKLAASSMAVVQETALQAATASHLPELLASLDKSMGVLHDVLEVRIQQLDVVLTQLHDSCAAAASQLAAAALAAEHAGASEAADQLTRLQELLASAITSVQEQVWAGYQQLALADHLSDMLLKIRASAAEVAASSTPYVDQLQSQLAELEEVAGRSVAALSANAMDQLDHLQLEQRLLEIETQASAAAAQLQAGLVQQYQEQLPVLQQRLGQLQDNLAGLAANAQQGLQQQAENAPELEALLLQLQQSMEATVKIVAEVAAAGADAAGQQLQVTSAGLGQLSGSVTEYVSSTAAGTAQNISSAAAGGSGFVSDVVQAGSAGFVVPPAGVAPVFEAAVAAAPAELVAPAAQDAVAAAAVVALPDREAIEAVQAAEVSYVTGTVDLSDASDAIKAIWANRPQ